MHSAGSEVQGSFLVLGSGLQVLPEPCGAADGATGELEEFCVLFSGQILEIERVVQVILCRRTMGMSRTPKN